jgi:hypothetical protein
MPAGYITQDGPRPEFRKMYGITEIRSRRYSVRTAMNVRESDGTLRFARNYNSPGEKCTLNCVHHDYKPHFDAIPGKTTPTDIVSWILANRIKVLNVAGNSEKTCPGIGKEAETFFLSTFTLLSTHLRR